MRGGSFKNAPLQHCSLIPGSVVLEMHRSRKRKWHVPSTADIVPRLLCAFLVRVSHGGHVHLAIFSLIILT